MTESVRSEEYRLCRGTLDFQESVISSESISWCSADQISTSLWAPSADGLSSFRPPLTTCLWTTPACQNYSCKPRSEWEALFEARWSQRCASLWSDSAWRGTKGGGGQSVRVLTLARTFSKEAGLTREKHIKNTSWERTREMASWDEFCLHVWLRPCVLMEPQNTAFQVSTPTVCSKLTLTDCGNWGNFKSQRMWLSRCHVFLTVTSCQIINNISLFRKSTQRNISASEFLLSR